MNNKLSDLDQLIEEILNEKDLYPRIPRTRAGTLYKSSLNKFFRVMGIPPTDANKELVDALFGLGKEDSDEVLTTADIQAAIDKKSYKDIIRFILIYGVANQDEELVNIMRSRRPEDVEIATGIKDGELNFATKYVPGWLKYISGDTNAHATPIAQTTKPFDRATEDDLVQILKNPKNKEHYWLVAFIDRAIVMAEKESFLSVINGFVLKDFPKLLQMVPRVDPGDRGLGKDSPLPSIPISGRYGARVGHETPKTLELLFRNIGLSSIDSVAGKVRVLGNFSKQLATGDLSNIKEYEKVFSFTIILDYLRRIIHDYEASAGGFLFENFLAMLFSGTKEGGNLKIEDFTLNLGGSEVLGSAKLYGPNVRSFSGSAKLFKEMIKRKGRNKIIYILAKKGEGLGSVKIYKTELYTSVDEEDPWGIYVMKGSDYVRVADASQYDNQIHFSWPSVPLVTIDLTDMKVNRDEYNETITKVFEQAKKGMANMFKSLNNLNASATRYFGTLKSDEESGADKNKAFSESLEAITDLRAYAYEALGGGLEDEGEYADVYASTLAKQEPDEKTSENKIETLDKLIERVIMYRTTEDK